MNCARCGKPAELVPQYQRWFCQHCKEYVAAPAAPPKGPNLGLIIGLPLGIIGGLMVLGILAAVAIPSFMTYTKKAKGSEAEINLERIYKGMKAYQIQNSALPGASAGPTPPLGACCDHPNRGKCAANLALWPNDPVWDALDFSVDEDHYFSYEYVPAGDSFTIRAYADLDCDSLNSTYEMTGAVVEGQLQRLGGISKFNAND